METIKYHLTDITLKDKTVTYRGVNSEGNEIQFTRNWTREDLLNGLLSSEVIKVEVFSPQ